MGNNRRRRETDACGNEAVSSGISAIVGNQPLGAVRASAHRLCGTEAADSENRKFHEKCALCQLQIKKKNKSNLKNQKHNDR